MFLQYPRSILLCFVLFTVVGGWLALERVRFSFDLQDFFPDGDEDIRYFTEFKRNFEPDDNFLLLAVRREEGLMDSLFLSDVLTFGQRVREIKGDSGQLIQSAQSLLNIEYPVKTPFAFTTIPAIHLEQPELYENDLRRALVDERTAGTLVSRDGKTLIIGMKTIDNIQQPDAERLILGLHSLLKEYPRLQNYYLLGRANFQKEMVEFQQKEFTFAFLVSGILVILVMYLIFRKAWGVAVAAGSILFGLGIFVAFLGLMGAKLDTMALLYPIVMIIVATSDVIHVMSKYIDELEKGFARMEAVKNTVREIGASIFLTSATTAIGFLSLISSKIPPIRAFGFNAAIGVMLAYLTVMTFTVAILTLFDKDSITKIRSKSATEGLSASFWTRIMGLINDFTRRRPRLVLASVAIFIGLCVFGAMRITTNNQIAGLLPRGAKVTSDFGFFEREFGGFRPIEMAIQVQPPYTADSFRVVQAIDRIEKQLKSYDGKVQNLNSITMLYKSMHRAHGGDRSDAYSMPEDEETFLKYQRLLQKLERAAQKNSDSTSSNNSRTISMNAVLVSQDRQKARISGRLLDLGADSIKILTADIEKWLQNNVDTSVLRVRQTGTGVIVDKNSEYVRNSLLYGLLFSVGIVSLVFGVLYRRLSMVLIALVPNVLPLLFAAALLGYAQIPLEGGVAIVFSIIFGIAVDDTIHFLGRYRLLRQAGEGVESAIGKTLRETGKAMVLTSLTLFFGFVVLLFSANPAANTVGLLISSTLLTALVFDLFLLPVLLRWVDKESEK